MKIAIFTDTFYPQINGVVTATINIAKGLAKKGHRVHIIAPYELGIKKEFKFPGVKINRVYGVPALFYEGFKVTPPFTLPLFNYIIKNKIELIHFQTPMTLGMNAIFIAKLLNIPLVGTFHTFMAHPEYRKHMGLNYNFAESLGWTYIRGYYNRCDLITAPSNETRKELLRKKLNGPIKVISNGINRKIFNNSKWRQVRESYGGNSKPILFIGRIAHEKNVFYLLECFKRVLKKVPSAKLIVIGDGPQMSEFKKKIVSNNLSKNVVLLGWVKHEELIKSSIFGACDLFVTASVTENQPMTVLEAQANGLPCIGLNEGGMKDLIKDGYNGYVINGQDKKAFSNRIIKLLSDKKLRDTMKKNTLREIENHDLPKIIDEWEKTYRTLIEKKPIA
jgi:1,2-diacylglycerol 3-alpha-glucosyltransferase